jgi:hypothetical protein
MLTELGEKDRLTTSAAIGQRLGWLFPTLVVATVVMTVALTEQKGTAIAVPFCSNASNLDTALLLLVFSVCRVPL